MDAGGVRSATVDDVPGIVQAYLSSWRAGYEGLLPRDVIEAHVSLRRAHDWSGAISSQASEVAVATENGDVVGVVEAAERPAHSGFFPLVYYRRDLLTHGA